MSLEDSDPENPPRPIPETTKSDDGLVDIGRDDLVKREKKRLGDYVAYLTKQVYKNDFPINPGTRNFRLKSPSGNPMPVVDAPFGAEKTYTLTLSENANSQKAKTIFETMSNSGMLDTDTPFVIKKGKADNNAKTGTEYFREIDDKLGEAEIPQRLDKVLLENNRFNDKNPAFASGQTEGVENSLGSLIVQPTLGQHSPGKFPSKTTGEGADFTSISIEKLKQFGLMTILNAGGEVNVPSPGPENDYLGTLGRNISTAAPGIARLGKRVEVSRFDGVRILNQIEPTFKKEIAEKTLQGRPVMSYGNVNSVLVPFDGLANSSSINSAAALGLTISGMLKSLYLLFNSFSAGQKTEVATQAGADRLTQEEIKKLRLGSYAGKDSLERHYLPFNEACGLNLVSTTYDYFECVNKGLDTFFYGNLNSVGGNTIEQTTKSHGYYNVIFRSLVSSTSDMLVGLVNNFQETGRSPFDVDPNLGGTDNVISDAVDTALGIIKIVNNSRLLKFMNVMAIIGEASIIGKTVGNDSTIDLIEDAELDEENRIIPKLGVLHAKSRLSSAFGNKMAWGKGTVRSMYLLPPEILAASQRYDGDSGQRLSRFTKRKGFQSSEGGSNRFTREELDKFEKYLEADYMPFYFHDLRTNEVTAFHAFLENISDSFSVEYSENEGYGRVGKVYTYKNTNRTIDLAFSVVATSLEDFDDMWLSINKLITLLYPQYTEGRNLQHGNNSFIQPFSQLPAASPLIRLRLGDILKSNYHKFDLARIFGVGQSSFFLESQQQIRQRQEQLQRRQTELENARSQARRRMEESNWRVGDKAILMANWTPEILRGTPPRDRLFYRKIRTEGNGSTRQGYFTGEQLRLTTPRKVRIESLNVTSAGGDGVEHLFSVSLLEPANDDERGNFAVGAFTVEIDEDYVSEIANRQVGTDSSAPPDSTHQDNESVAAFFSAEGETPNPIFKSFESVRGKGLAGFIKNFNIEIDQKFPWETIGLNNRAPKMVKISMQFLPIHDLQPGLDSNGFNSAPIYNVGPTLRKFTSDDGGASEEAENADYKAKTAFVVRRNGNDTGNV